MDNTLPADTPGRCKRKRNDQMLRDNEGNDNDATHTSARLLQLANKIGRDLNQTAADGETIQICGPAALHIIATHPEAVLTLANKHLHARPFAQVAVHWRRLYEDASLHKVVKLLENEASSDGGDRKRRKVDDETEDWVTGIVNVLDTTLNMTGAPGRRNIIENTFHGLGQIIDSNPQPPAQLPSTFRIHSPEPLTTDHPITVAKHALEFEAFQHWLDKEACPVIIPDTMTAWPATRRWSDPNYLLHSTLGGRRLVPVEIGESYTDDNWSQRIMPMSDFMRTFLLPENPPQIGYLAQHDLFAQIPALRRDVTVPDYCYTSPPSADRDAIKDSGLKEVSPLDEPLLNAWLGPKGTKTPLHTDPYHNILCQVVGYKYIRLYPPSETPKLYPLGVNEAGIDMENTSSVDVKLVRPQSLGGESDVKAIEELERSFPLFMQAEYVEAVLGPGQCLYVPLGWWHYVESLTTSFSVSFWWN